MADIHLQQSALQENNNGGSRDSVKGVVDTRDSRVEVTDIVGPDEMWAPGSSPGHTRELPVDVPDTLLQQAYANKQVMSLMLNRSETTSSSASAYRQLSKDHSDRNPSENGSPDNSHQLRHKNNTISLRVKTNAITGIDNVDYTDDRADRLDSPIETSVSLDNKVPPRIIEISVLSAGNEADRDMSSPLPRKIDDTLDSDENAGKSPPGKINPFDMTDDEEDLESPSPKITGDLSTSAILVQKESSVDADEDYPFAKEDYPTMLKTCSDDSASPRSSSGRSDSTAPMDGSLIMAGKESPLYDARRIDLGSPCRPLVPEIKIAPIFGRGRETTSFDNPAYGLSADLHDLHQGLLMRSDEVTDLTRLIDEQQQQQSLVNGRKTGRANDKSPISPAMWSSKDHLIHQHHHIRNGPIGTQEVAKIKKKASSKRQNDVDRIKSRSSRDSDLDIDSEGLIGAGSTDDLLSADLRNLTITRSKKKKQQQQQHTSSGYSTLRSDASIGDFTDQGTDRSFLVVGSRSYREVAVDCPADFVPVTKSHPVYPPPNRVDSTLDRCSTLRSLKSDDPKRTIKDPLTIDDSGDRRTNDQADHHGSGDVVNDVGSGLGGNQESRHEKVRSRVKCRVLRYRSGLKNSIGRKMNLTNASDTNKAFDASSARISGNNCFGALTVSHASNKTTAPDHERSADRKKFISPEKSRVPRKIIDSAKKRQRAQKDYVDDRIPRSGSSIDLMQRETNENSRNSLRELVGLRDPTPVIVYYSSREEKTWLFDDLSRDIDEANEDNEKIDDPAKLENAKNSILENCRTDDDARDDSVRKKSFASSRSSPVGKIVAKFKSDSCLFRDFDSEKFVLESRIWFSEPCVDHAGRPGSEAGERTQPTGPEVLREIRQDSETSAQVKISEKKKGQRLE